MKKSLITILLILASFFCVAQNKDYNITDGVILEPETQANLNALSGQIKRRGLLIFNDDTGFPQFYDGVAFQDFSGTLDGNDYPTAVTLTGSTLTLVIPGQTNPTVDLAALLDNTDTQTITDLSLSGNTLTITISNGNTQTVDLSSLVPSITGNEAAFSGWDKDASDDFTQAQADARYLQNEVDGSTTNEIQGIENVLQTNNNANGQDILNAGTGDFQIINADDAEINDIGPSIYFQNDVAFANNSTGRFSILDGGLGIYNGPFRITGLSGNGSGFVTVDNEGDLGFTATAGGGSQNLNSVLTEGNDANGQDIQNVGDFNGLDESLINGFNDLPSGYVNSDPVNFRFDQDVLMFVNRKDGPTVTSNQLNDSNIDKLFSQYASSINLASYTSPLVIEVQDIDVGSTANTKFYPYIFMHAAQGNIISVDVELEKGNNFDPIRSIPNATGAFGFGIDKHTSGTGNLTGARFTINFTEGQNIYVRKIGVIGRNNDGYQWTVKRSGDEMFGDLSMNDNKITNLANPTNAQDAATKDYVDGILSDGDKGDIVVSNSGETWEIGSQVINHTNIANGAIRKEQLQNYDAVTPVSLDVAVNDAAPSGKIPVTTPDGSQFQWIDFSDVDNSQVAGGSGSNYRGNLFIEPMTATENGSEVNVVDDGGELKRRAGLVDGGQHQTVLLDNTHPIGAVYTNIVGGVNDSITVKAANNNIDVLFIGQPENSTANQVIANVPQPVSFYRYADNKYHVTAIGTFGQADNTPPTITGVQVLDSAPNELLVSFSENVGYGGVNGVSFAQDFSDITMTGLAGIDGDQIRYGLSRNVENGETGNVTFGNGFIVQDLADNQLVTPVTAQVSNNVAAAQNNLYAENDAASPTAESNSVGSNWFFSGSELSDGLASTQGAGVTNGSYALTVTENTGSTFSRARHTGNYGAGTYNLTMDANLVGGNTSARIVVIDGTAGNSTELATATLSNSVNNINLNFTATVSDWSILVYPAYFTAGNGSIEFDNVVITQ